MTRVLLPAFVLLSLATASAQQDMGSVTGTVHDGSGAVLPGVRVTVTELATGVSTETTTNAEGLYTLPALKIGRYRVTAELPAFKRAVVDSVQVSAQSRVRVDLRLELGTMSEEVSVRGDAPLLQTETSSLAHVLGENEIKELPLNGRNFQQLAVLAAGVLPAFGHRDREGGFNSHGQWATQNNFILDGVDNNSQVLGMEDRKAQVLIPSLDAVQEYQIQTSNYSAEFGRNAGAVMNVSIKSGTNQVKGTAYEFARHDRFDARDAFAYADRNGDGKADPEELRQHQFGMTIGGPIRVNRTFFFASVEALRSRTTEGSSVTVPTLLERQGIFDPAIVTIRDPAAGQPFPGNTIPRNRWDPVAAALITLFPEPNFVDSTRDNYVSSPKHARDRYQYDVRLDHNFSSSDKAFVRLSRMDVRDDREGPLPPPAVGAPNNETSLNDNQGHSLALSATRIFGARVVNEARFGFNSLETDKHPLVGDAVNEQFGLRVVAPQPVSGLARMTFSGALGYVTLGDATFTPNYKLSRTFQVLDNLTMIRGRHSLKAGGDLRWIQADIVGAPQTRGIFNFNGKFTGSSLGDFLLGMTNTRQMSTFQQGNLRERNFMFYVQDDWKIGPRLTLNLGVRYELSSPMFDTQDRMTTLDLSAIPSFRVIRAGEAGDSWSSRGLINTDTNNWAPRLGFAWQPGSRWSLRGASGIFYGTTGGGLGASSRLINNWPIYRDVTIRSTPTRSAGQLVDGLDPTVLGSTEVMPDNLNWNVWARDFKLPTIQQWNLSIQRQLGSDLTAMVSYVGSLSRHLPTSYNTNSAGIGPPATERQRRPIPSLGTINFREPSAKASYHGMEATLDKRLSAGFQFSLSYTWSHSIDNAAELFGAEGAIVQDVRNLSGDRGNSGFDRRHRFAGSSVYELPFGAGRRWLGNAGVLGKILGGWQMSTIVSMQSGRYFDVTLPDPTTLLGVTSSNWRADLVGDPRPANPGPDGWLNPAAFAVPQNPDGSYRFGNLGRNSLVGPGYFNLDVGLMRNFQLGASRRLQVRWEVFNATNHPSYGLPTSNLLSSDFGTIRGTVSAPRQMQFGLKFIY
jgi:hypothetical protein